ncbi:hypothetical protein JZ751_028840 [Albula glossodonta]|uniref:Uncharacterized protein n=1 Tax=Albula glossodonta TaxID=121402 RepID=A0A8T2NAR3_9TELE|nr:hypothetical protein JZ751_028840 [Albula glossodonta]
MPYRNGLTVSKRKHGVYFSEFGLFSSLLFALCCFAASGSSGNDRGCRPCPNNCNCSIVGPQDSCVVNCSNIGLDRGPEAVDLPTDTNTLFRTEGVVPCHPFHSRGAHCALMADGFSEFPTKHQKNQDLSGFAQQLNGADTVTFFWVFLRPHPLVFPTPLSEVSSRNCGDTERETEPGGGGRKRKERQSPGPRAAREETMPSWLSLPSWTQPDRAIYSLRGEERGEDGRGEERGGEERRGEGSRGERRRGEGRGGEEEESVCTWED